MKQNQLFNGTLIFFLLIIGALVFARITHSTKGYKTGNRDLLQELSANDYIMPYGSFSALYNDSAAVFTIADLRSPDAFAKGSLRHAINVPFEAITSEENLDLLKETAGLKLIVGAGQSDAVMAYLMWRSLGVKDIMVLPGSFDVLNEHIVKNPNPAYFYYSEDKAAWDYARQMGGQSSSKITAQPSLPQQTTVKTAVKGGC